MKILIIAATTTDTSGYGLMTKGFIDSLYGLKDKGKIKCIDIFNQELLNNPKEYDITITVMNPGSFIDLLKRNPRLYEIYKDTKRNAFNVIFETDRLPSPWIPIFKLEFITDYIVQSEFMKEQVKENTDKSLWGNIWTIYPVVNEDNIKEIKMEDRLKEDKFRVLTIGQYTIRKGLLEALISFTRELGEENDTEMILKYNLLSRVEADPIDVLQATVKSNSKRGSTNANITTISTALEYEDIIKLYQSASVLLIPSRGEGFGIPPVEAMLSGTPVIYTNWSALVEVCNLTGNYPVDYFLDEAYSMSHYGYEKGLKYAIPLISSTMDALRLAYNTWKNNREEYYKSNRDIMIDRYGVGAVLLQMENMINDEKETSSRT